MAPPGLATPPAIDACLCIAKTLLLFASSCHRCASQSNTLALRSALCRRCSMPCLLCQCFALRSEPCRCPAVHSLAMPLLSGGRLCRCYPRIAVPLQNYSLPIPALPAPRAVPSRSADAMSSQTMPLVRSAVFCHNSSLHCFAVAHRRFTILALPMRCHAEPNYAVALPCHSRPCLPLPMLCLRASVL